MARALVCRRRGRPGPGRSGHKGSASRLPAVAVRVKRRLATAACYADRPPGPRFASASCSSRRELMPSLVKTLRRCHSTVRADRNSWAPISGLVRPSRASRAIGRFLGGERRPAPGPCACGRSRRWPAARAGPVRRTPRRPSRPASRARSAAARGRPRGGSHGAATRRRAGGPGRAPGGAGCGRAGRSPRGTSPRRSRPRSAARASAPRSPSPKSVPPACVVSASRASAPAAAGCPRCATAASISSGSAHMDM